MSEMSGIRTLELRMQREKEVCAQIFAYDAIEESFEDTGRF